MTGTPFDSQRGDSVQMGDQYGSCLGMEKRLDRFNTDIAARTFYIGEDGPPPGKDHHVDHVSYSIGRHDHILPWSDQMFNSEIYTCPAHGNRSNVIDFKEGSQALLKRIRALSACR